MPAASGSLTSVPEPGLLSISEFSTDLLGTLPHPVDTPVSGPSSLEDR